MSAENIIYPRWVGDITDSEAEKYLWRREAVRKGLAPASSLDEKEKKVDTANAETSEQSERLPLLYLFPQNR